MAVRPDFTPKTNAQRAINSLIDVLKKSKPGDRSPIDRAYSIIITQVEIVRAYIFVQNL